MLSDNDHDRRQHNNTIIGDGKDQGGPDTSTTSRQSPPPASAKKRRKHYSRSRKEDCNWWRMFLNPQVKNSYANEPNGRDSLKFRRMFRVTYEIFKTRLLDLALELWWPAWHEHATDCLNKPMADLRLKLLGALFTLATGATHFVVSTNTNISEEAHRFFF